MNIDNVLQEETKKFIKAITGLPIVEFSEPDKWGIRVGRLNPLEVGFHPSKHPGITIESLRFSAYCALLKAIADQMRQSDKFIQWVNTEKISAN